MSMKIGRRGLLGLSLAAALAGVFVTPATAQAQAGPVAAIANALIQFETATRWEAMAPTWRARRDPWIAHVRAAATPAQLGALALELETIMTWEAMYPRWRQERPGWVARAQATATPHDAAQLLLALEAATTWTAMFENRWRAVRAGWIANLSRF